MNHEIKYVSVTALNRYLAYKFDNDQNLQEVYLKGEISNFKYSNRHAYFSIKDQTSEIQGMFFYPSNQNLKFKPCDGMSVLVSGHIQVYQKKGTYAIIVNQMEQVGMGIIYQEFLALKEKLAKEGLFDEERKLPIPEYPEKVAIITALTGEAINDIISTFNRRLPIAKLRLYPALVQGMDAPRDLVRALMEVYSDNWADVIIIGRGGGSYEDLSCFNDEVLCRLIAQTKIPIISAVGHEGDFTICDFVASYRAPTPTGAAMRLSKDFGEVVKMLSDKMVRLQSSIKSVLANKFYQYDKLLKSYALAHFETILNSYEHKLVLLEEKLKNLSPFQYMENMTKKLNDLTNNLIQNFNFNLNLKSEKINNLLCRLNPSVVMTRISYLEQELEKLIEKSILLNPFNIMLKGYTLTYQDGKIVKTVKKINQTKPVQVVFHDGFINTTVDEIKIKE